MKLPNDIEPFTGLSSECAEDQQLQFTSHEMKLVVITENGPN